MLVKLLINKFISHKNKLVSKYVHDLGLGNTDFRENTKRQI
jgi:hypothetical protein